VIESIALSVIYEPCSLILHAIKSLLPTAQLAGFLIFAVRFRVQTLAVERVAELGVKPVVFRFNGDGFAISCSSARPLLSGEVFLTKRNEPVM
jgi:hypothetical protein